MIEEEVEIFIIVLPTRLQTLGATLLTSQGDSNLNPKAPFSHKRGIVNETIKPTSRLPEEISRWKLISLLLPRKGPWSSLPTSRARVPRGVRAGGLLTFSVLRAPKRYGRVCRHPGSVMIEVFLS